jgi:hypothetical protein
MFPDNAGMQGDGFVTSAVNQQNTSLLGNPQVQSVGMPAFDPSAMNTTAPLSSFSNPNVANMVQALKGTS